ncbi:pentatricopeptide repeat-containing protein At4g02750-like [Selaginella moellendorffii]|uniref:pentatricopeptide repeat-containing protein At4g02750-like n=1 Tax=Selaginella moellendorffii TaxID=88036 RepID=UPI000D1C7A83|nr:pentatricopeptide repeat-containing protein At4g02750-like [Selaginella moellendorffii]|eukprot:XP_024534088.1 pentatricopeptide repeat-containing protein At4g02750-like [Selaginella moellendorffii]
MLSAYTQMDEAKELFKLAKDPAVDLWVTMIEGTWGSGWRRRFSRSSSFAGHERAWGAIIAAFAASGDLATVAQDEEPDFSSPSRRKSYSSPCLSSRTTTCGRLFLPEAGDKELTGRESSATAVSYRSQSMIWFPRAKRISTRHRRCFFSSAFASRQWKQGTTTLLDCKKVHWELVKNSRDTDAEHANGLIQMYGDCGAFPDAWAVFHQITQRNVVSWNMMIRAGTKSSHLQEANELFHRMPATNLVSWNLVVAAYNQQNQLEESRSLFDRMPERNVMSGNSMVAAYAQNGHMEEARRILERMPEHSVVTWTALMVGLAKQSSVPGARSLFLEMPERNAASWNAIIQAYARGGYVEEAERFFQRMPQHSVLSSTELLTAYAQRGDPDSLDAAKRVFESTRYPDSICWNAMLGVYSRSGDVAAGKSVFDRCPERTVVSWNNLIQALGENGNFQAAKLVFVKMPERDVVSWTVVLSHSQALDEAKQLFDSMPERSVVPWTAMVVAAARAGEMEDADEVFAKSPQLDEIAWSAMISGCSLNGQAVRAVELFKAMDLEGLRIDAVALVSVIDACSIVASVAAESAHAIIRELELEVEPEVSQSNGFLGTEMEADVVVAEKSVAVGNALINLYGKTGQPGRSKAVFDRMVATRNRLSWTGLLSAHAHSGLALECLELSRDMKLEGVAPDGVALMSVLSACSHAGMGGAAAEELDVAAHEYGVAVAAEHLVCVADALGRAGEVAEACAVLERFGAGVVAWMSLLAACGRVGEEAVGRRAADRVVEMDPENAASAIAMCFWNEGSPRQRCKKDEELQCWQ